MRKEIEKERKLRLQREEAERKEEEARKEKIRKLIEEAKQGKFKHS